MTFEEFDKLQQSLFDDIVKIGAGKGREYASSDDRLANFKRLAPECGIKPELVAWVYFRKHLDSISTYLKEGKELSEETIRGRFLDAINYLTLIYGLIVESQVNQTKLEYTNHPAPFILHELTYEKIEEETTSRENKIDNSGDFDQTQQTQTKT